jgi:predicted nuclease of predicted toxin-antitoxin system
VPLLASHGWEVRYWATVGPGGAPDTDLMNWAREHQHVIVTQDLDFS